MEGQPGSNIDNWTNGTGKVEKDKWQLYEVYVKMSKVGNGEFKMWQDGSLKATRTGVNTLNSKEKYMRFYRLCLYWNGGPVQDQVMWWDAEAVAVKTSGAQGGAVRDDTPFMDRDADGNPFIGLAT